MTVQAMNHFTILTDDVTRTIAFYDDLLGLKAGPRPDFAFPGAWLYAKGEPILHVIGGRPKGELHAGVIDHMAFTATDLPGTVAKLDKAKVKWELRRLPAESVRGGTWQLFFDDPHGGKVEFDFDKSEPAPAGHQA